MDTQSWSVNIFSWLCHSSGPNRFKLLNASLSVQPSCVLFHPAPAIHHISIHTSSEELCQHLRFRRHSPDQSTRVEVSLARADEPWLIADRFWVRQCRKHCYKQTETHICNVQKPRVTSSYPANQNNLATAWAVQETLLLGSAVLLLFRRCAL